MKPTYFLLICVLVSSGDGFLLDDKPISTTPSTTYSVEDLVHLIVEEKALRNNLESKMTALTKELRNVERIVTDFYHDVKDNITMLQATVADGNVDKRLSDMEKKLNETKVFAPVQATSANGVVDKLLSDMDKKLNETKSFFENITTANAFAHKRTESKLISVENKCKLNEVKIINMTVSAQQTNHLLQSRINGIENTVMPLIRNVSSLNSTVGDVEMNVQKLMAFKTEYLHRSSYAFNAYMLKDLAPKMNETLIFTKELLDEHGVYNDSTGEYLVPVTGTYSFSTTLCNSPGGHRWVAIDILADQYVMNSFFLGNLDGDICTSTSTMDFLRKGTIVKIIVRAIQSASDDSLYQSGSRMCSFSGFLIK